MKVKDCIGLTMRVLGYIIDNNPEKNGTVLQNHNIFMIDDVARDNNGYLFIVSVKDDIQCKLINNNICKIYGGLILWYS